MRWPTALEQGIGVLLFVFFGAACMVALAVGLGDRAWADSVVRLLVFAFDSYKQTIKKAVQELAKKDATIERLGAELDELEAVRKTLIGERDEARRERDQAQRSLADVRKQLTDERKACQEQIDMIRQERDREGKRANTAELELFHIRHKNDGQGLVEYALVLVLIAITVIGVLAVTGHTLDASWYTLVIERFPQ